MATGYQKTVKLFLEGAPASVDITGGKAVSLQRRLDNDARVFHITDASDAKKELYYNLFTNSGKAVLLAEVTVGAETKGQKYCEETLAQPAQEPDSNIYTAPVLKTASPDNLKVAELAAGKEFIIEGEHLANAQLFVNKNDSTSAGKLENVTSKVVEVSATRIKVLVKASDFSDGAPAANNKFYFFAKNGSKYSGGVAVTVKA